MVEVRDAAYRSPYSALRLFQYEDLSYPRAGLTCRLASAYKPTTSCMQLQPLLRCDTSLYGS